LESGDKIPADIKLLQSNELRVDESLLTGESLEVKKEVHNQDLNMVFAGTVVTKGRAMGKVVAIALKSQIGKIATLLNEASKGEAPLEVRTKKLSVSIAKVIIMVIAVIFFIGFFKDMPFKELIFLSVALIVSAIPEGLPISITIALSRASYAMSKKGVIVRKLSAIESLGSCTLIASDKTGTLTKNKLSVDRFVEYDALKKQPNDHIIKIASLLCNEIKYEHSENGLSFIGDQVDIALARHIIDLDEEYLLNAKEYKKVDDIPYESQNRYSAVMVHKDEIQYEFVKGSPETILEFCNLTEQDKEAILKQVNEYAANGFRNIALGYKEEKINDHTHPNITLKNFSYLGFMAIIDPIREES
ncbi:MAG: ATPase, partial [Deltaproteobacteria bacterium HGW-Deltaproteobacteria-24]